VRQYETQLEGLRAQLWLPVLLPPELRRAIGLSDDMQSTVSMKKTCDRCRGRFPFAVRTFGGHR